jgi:hypothetical protein
MLIGVAISCHPAGSRTYPVLDENDAYLLCTDFNPVASDFSFTDISSSGGTTSGSYTAFTAALGIFDGTFTTSASGAGVHQAFLSPDKTFLGIWACDTTDAADVFVGYPGDC